MIYPYMVNYNGTYYEAGEFVPDTNVGSETPISEEVTEQIKLDVVEEKAEEVVETPKAKSKTNTRKPNKKA